MGMRISASATAGLSSGVQWQQRQQNMKSLLSALQAGDLAGAQKAYAGLGAGGATPTGNNPLTAIGQALQNNDLAAAQKAAQQMQAQRGSHTHHSDAAAPAATGSSPLGGTTATSGTLVNLLA